MRPTTKGFNASSLYGYLSASNALAHQTAACLAAAGVPEELIEDASQEIHALWASLPLDNTLLVHQCKAYAYRTGVSAAVRVRLTLGAVVKLPEGMFTFRAAKLQDGPKLLADYGDTLFNPLNAHDPRLDAELTERLGRPPTQATPSQVRTAISTVKKPSHVQLLEAILVEGLELDEAAATAGLTHHNALRVVNRATNKLLAT